MKTGFHYREGLQCNVSTYFGTSIKIYTVQQRDELNWLASVAVARNLKTWKFLSRFKSANACPTVLETPHWAWRAGPTLTAMH